MRAILRWKMLLLAGGLVLVPAITLAQSVSQPATTSTPAPAPDTIGPRELQNFSLPGNVTRPADEPRTPPQAPAADQSTTAPTGATSSATVRTAVPAPTARQRAPTTARASDGVAREATPVPAVLPPPQAVPMPQLSSAPVERPDTVPSPTLAPERKLPILPWLAAALALAAATLVFLWRRRPREAVAGPTIDLFVAPQAAPPIQPPPPPLPPSPSPPRAAEPAPLKRSPSVANGIVATRLRPSIEIGMLPLRCVVDDDKITVEFEVELFNAGTAPARAVLAEASLLNAGATQNEELAGFFANPVGAGQRLDAIPPLSRIALTSQVVAPRSAVEEYELGGRKVFVPVVAFNALYEWSGGTGQTSAAYLVGRDTGGEKLGPLRLDLGHRDVRGLAAHALPVGLSS
jgi:hypothetical protein